MNGGFEVIDEAVNNLVKLILDYSVVERTTFGFGIFDVGYKNFTSQGAVTELNDMAESGVRDKLEWSMLGGYLLRK